MALNECMFEALLADFPWITDLSPLHLEHLLLIIYQID